MNLNEKSVKNEPVFITTYPSDPLSKLKLTLWLRLRRNSEKQATASMNRPFRLNFNVSSLGITVGGPSFLFLLEPV